MKILINPVTKMSNRKLFRIVVVCIGVILIGYKIVGGFLQNARAFDEDLPSGFTLNPDILSLISKKYKDKIKVDVVLRSKVRNPISFITIDNDYRMIIYKIDVSSNKSIDSIINFKNLSTERSTGITYSV